MAKIEKVGGDVFIFPNYKLLAYHKNQILSQHTLYFVSNSTKILTIL